MNFVVAIAALLFFAWSMPNAAWAIIPREPPASIVAARFEDSCKGVNSGDWTMYYVLSDPQGNVAALATADGTLVAEYGYDPYGRLIRETGPKATSCPFRYSTKYRDPDLELYYYGYRWCDAAAMKWLTPDPIGERGGANLTAFCSADPINQVDPLGLDSISVDEGRVFWNVERDWIGPFNPKVNQFEIGILRQNTVVFLDRFGGGSAPLEFVKKSAREFWNRPLMGTSLDPRDISCVPEDVQRGVVADYLQHYVRDYGHPVLREYRGHFTSKIDRMGIGVRIAGVAQMFGGGMEAFSGAMFGGLTCKTVFGGLVGAAIAAHGADQFLAGLRKLASGESVPTTTSHIIRNGFGVSARTADSIDGLLTIVFSAGTGAVNYRSWPNAAGVVRVTSWAPEGVPPTIGPQRWVMIGEPTRVNYWLSGVGVRNYTWKP